MRRTGSLDPACLAAGNRKIVTSISSTRAGFGLAVLSRSIEAWKGESHENQKYLVDRRTADWSERFDGRSSGTGEQ